MKRLCLLVLSLPLLLIAGSCVGYEKSSHPLGPSVAGPIAGVSITQPTPVTPAQGSQITVGNQPITLTVQNAATTGVRPLSYLFEVAVDVDFTNKFFVREGIPPGGNGQTSVQLPELLAPERSYYWRAKAQDGANTGVYSYPVVFNIFTPIVIGKPQAISPKGSTNTLQPRFTIGNAPRSGPVGRITYAIEVANNDAFASPLGVWAVDEQPNETTLDSPIRLPAGTQLFWRTQAYDPTTLGPLSDISVFSTPAAPSPGPGTPCGPPYPTTPLGIVECRRSQYGPTMSSSEVVSMLRGIAKDLNAAGIPNGPFGILKKSGGSSCDGYSCDIICSGQGTAQNQWDVLIDAEGAAYPTWAGPHVYPNIRVDVCEIQ